MTQERFQEHNLKELSEMKKELSEMKSLFIKNEQDHSQLAMKIESVKSD